MARVRTTISTQSLATIIAQIWFAAGFVLASLDKPWHGLVALVVALANVVLAAIIARGDL